LNADAAHLKIETPAKINLGLRIVGRREDGYHLIESVFAPIDLHDDITLDWAPGPDEIDFALEIDPEANLPPGLSQVTDGPDNLVVRAARGFRSVCPRPGRLRVRLRKRIPSGAGLGGGSSDAGAVLAGLARLAGRRAPSPRELESLALDLGADVPYFLRPRPAIVSGIGERIEPLERLPALPIVLANPGISVATAEVYQTAARLRDSLTESGAGSTMRRLSELCEEIGSGTPTLGELLRNDLEIAAIRRCPPVGRLIALLRETEALGVGMSGSGGTVFGVYGSRAEAERGAERLRSLSRNASMEKAGGASEAGEASSDGIGPAAWVKVSSTSSVHSDEPMSR
jgi:4-diphosphocytidyl-2-C-methyl-D-erythritol kinase